MKIVSVAACLVGLLASVDGSRKDQQFLFISPDWDTETQANWTNTHIMDTYIVSHQVQITIPSPGLPGDEMGNEKYKLFPAVTQTICDDEVVYTSKHVTYTATITCAPLTSDCPVGDTVCEADALAAWEKSCDMAEVKGGTLAADSETGVTIFIPDIPLNTTKTIQLNLRAHLPTGGNVNVWSKTVTLNNPIRTPFKLKSNSAELLTTFTAKVANLTFDYKARNLQAGKLPGIYNKSGLGDTVSVAKGMASTFYLDLSTALPTRRALFDTPAGDVSPEGMYVDPVGDYDAIRYNIKAEIPSSPEGGAAAAPAVAVTCNDPRDVEDCAIVLSVSNDEAFYTISIVNPTEFLDTDVHVIFYATDKNRAEVELTRWSIRAAWIDTDDNVHGPGNTACNNSGVQVDVALDENGTYAGAFDGAFTCDCSNTPGYEGDNCETKTYPADICQDGTFYQVNETTRNATCSLQCPEDVINALFVGAIELKSLQRLARKLDGTAIDYHAVSPDLEGLSNNTDRLTQCGNLYNDPEKDKWFAAEGASAVTPAGSFTAAVSVAAASAFFFALA